MKEFFGDRRFVIACSIGVMIILIIAIFTISFIWKSNMNWATQNSTESNASEDNTIGKYSTVSVTEEEQLKKYINDISNKLRSKDIDGLYNMLNLEYIAYFKLNKSSFQTLLEGKGLFGRSISLSSYKRSMYNGKVFYVLEYSSTNNTASGVINMIETSPNNYSIAFDEFVSYKTTSKVLNKEGLQVTIYDKVFFNSKLYFKVKVKNLNNYNITLNASGAYDNNYLKFNNGTEQRTISSTISGDIITLEKDKEINYSLEFSIDELMFGSVDSLVIKDIIFSNSGVRRNYEFEFN